MGEKEFKPVLIRFDRMEFERHIHLINFRLIPKLNEIKSEFLKLDIGQLTNEYLNDILFDEMQLIRSQLTDRKRYENKNVLSRIEKLLNEFTEPGNMEISIVIGYPSIDDSGNIVFNDEAIQELREFHSEYVITEKGIELLELHSKAATALNEFYQKAIPNVSPDEIGPLFNLDISGKVKPALRDYDIFRYAKQQKVNYSL